ncbi:MAG TPA: 3'-5' exonuclease [Candidatus Acidoferrales bacterium]|jgi:superfamily I DNA/RNA helicase|nr:3'-5' exonuclease [Candidatus Acidoferrales bacterium]
MIDAPLDVCTAIVGVAGTGTTTALLARAERAAREHPEARPLIAPSQTPLDALALEIVRGANPGVRLVDDVDAEALFAGACAPLFALEWEELGEPPSLDPEVPGLRSPERFIEAAFRLVRKLRDASIGPADFLQIALARATEFYAKPPNFADPKLLIGTKDAYRDSLAVDTKELQRQYRREVDLAKILGKVYTRYVELIAESNVVTARDAAIAATEILRGDAALASRLRETHRFAFVDEAQNLRAVELRLLQAIFGDALAGVTFAGDPSSATAGFGAPAPNAAFALAAARFELHEQHRTPLAVELACRALTAPREPIQANAVDAHVRTYRAQDQHDEAAFVAATIADAIAAGTAPGEIAVLMRSVSSPTIYENALLDRGVPVSTSGDWNVFSDRRALDALALLWNVVDPFRHDWLLRTLGNPAVALSDASLATLCAEPPNPQRPLFSLDTESAPTVRASRWDPKRDLRLGWNVVRGDQDAALSEEARARLVRFRERRETWLAAMETEPFAEFASLVWNEGLAREGAPGSARERTQRLVLERLLGRLAAFLDAAPEATVADALEYSRLRAESAMESCEDDRGEGFVHLSSIDAARGRGFDLVFVANVRAGAFPRWYVPDAFLFSPRLGMIPKENAGGGRAARTAKFSYYMHYAKAREKYNEGERRALVYALRRTKRDVYVTTSGSATRGVTAPEFFEELRNARLPGSKAV